MSYRHIPGRHTCNLWEGILACVVTITGILYRINVCLKCGGEQIVETDFYQSAVLQAEKKIEATQHMLSYLYTLCLSACMTFLGNKPIVGIWLQVVIQSVTLILAYIMIRRILGRIPALFLLSFLALSPAYVEQIFVLTPECLFLLLYLIGIYITVSLVKNYCYDHSGTVARTVSALSAGMLIGILAYLDPVMFTLLVFMVGIIAGKDTKGINPILHLFLSLAVSVLVFADVIWIDASLHGREFVDSAVMWGSFFPHTISVKNIIVLYYTQAFLWELFFLVIGSSFLLMAFWNRKKVQNCTPWIILLLFTMLGISPYQMQLFLIWGVLAGIGLQQSFEPMDNKTDRKTAREEKMTAKGMESSGADLKEMGIKAEKPIKYIENPLPLPKKHVKREMDYQYQVTENQMKFDIEISDEDEFDI